MLILGMACYKGHAQMAAAATVGWVIDVHLDVPIDQDSVWTLLKDHAMVSKLSNGYVQSVVGKDFTLPIPREVSLQSGQKREEILTQLDVQHKFLVYRIDKASLPQGLRLVQVAVFTKEHESGSSSINWKVIIEGNDEAKKQEIVRMKGEIEHYKAGWSAYLRKD